MAETLIRWLTPSIYCWARVSAFCLGEFAVFVKTIFDPLANGLLTSCAVCVLI